MKEPPRSTGIYQDGREKTATTLEHWRNDTVERDRLRERERQARAQMSSQVAEQESPGPPGNYLFQAPIRVNPSSADPVTQQIQSKLGDFQRVRRFLDQKDSSGLIGVDGAPPPSPGGPPSSMLQSAAASSSTLVAAGRHPPPVGQSTQGATGRLQPSPDSHSSNAGGGGEFKKPHHQPHHHHSHHPTQQSHHTLPPSHLYHAPPPPLHHSQQPQQRGGYVKPADGKPPYGGRGGYPGQPVKHGSAGTASHRANGVVPAKGPPLGGGLSGIGSGGLAEVSPGRAMAERQIRNAYEQVDNISEENRVSLNSPEASLDEGRPSESVTDSKRKGFFSTTKNSSRKRKVDHTRSHRDEFSLFGKYVANKLRKLPTDHARRMVQNIINKTLSEAEAGKFNDPVDFDEHSEPSTSGQSRSDDFILISSPSSDT